MLAGEHMPESPVKNNNTVLRRIIQVIVLFPDIVIFHALTQSGQLELKHYQYFTRNDNTSQVECINL